MSEPCNWREFPELLGEAIYVLPEGSTKVTFPYKCAPGLLGGSGSTMGDHLTILCAGLCPAGYICPKEATVEKEDVERAKRQKMEVAKEEMEEDLEAYLGVAKESGSVLTETWSSLEI